MAPLRTELDQASIQAVLERLRKALDEIGNDLGLRLSVRRATYSNVRGEIVVEAATISKQGLMMNKDAEAFLRRASHFGLSPSDLGRVYTCGGRRYRIIGLRPRSLQPVICEHMDPPTGTKFLMAADSVRYHLSHPDGPECASTGDAGLLPGAGPAEMETGS
jgi:hypothetical protein